LRELELKSNYDSDEDDILGTFYIPVLSKALQYDRLAGFFSSSALAIAARGIARLVENKGLMRLVVGARLSAPDVDAIVRARQDPERILSEAMLSEFNRIEDTMVSDHVKALAYLVAKGHLEIRVALVYDTKGLPLPYEEASSTGIFHQKVGVIRDRDGNTLSFSGSINESASAWTANIEEFKVFRSWQPGEQPHLDADVQRFEKYWRGEAAHVRVLDVPAAVRERLVEIAPDDLRDLNLERRYWQPRLRAYQEEAVRCWVQNAGKGIFEMATGTGKTYTAIGCLLHLLRSEHPLLAVVSVPFKHLVDQWQENLARFGMFSEQAYSLSPSKLNQIADRLFDLQNGISEYLILLTTHDTLYLEKFCRLVRKSTVSRFLIADEVHGLGSPERQGGLLQEYSYRLGLSATPTRWFDPEGTAVLQAFFDKTVFEFPLAKAIDAGYLCQYEYYPLFSELNEAEMKRYYEWTEKIARKYAKSLEDEKEREIFGLYCILRQKVVVNASAKLERLESILDGLPNLSHCLVYCSPQQIREVQQIMNRHGIRQHKFTARESATKRQELLDQFADGHYRVLVAMRCLDEGVDVPSTRTAVILASSTNPREFIQRRGRILRNYEGKKKATIFDVVVVPSLSETRNEYFGLEAKIMETELRRFVEFARSATNAGIAYAGIAEFASKYDLTLEGSK
jgi:superfamily II DNA or RNA helicase